MATRTLYLVRHGQYLPHHQPGEVQDGSLTELGLEQCALLAARLADYKISKIYYSPLKRSYETAAIIAREIPGIPLEADPLLEECIPALPPNNMLTPNQEEFFAALPANALTEGKVQARKAFEKYFRPAEGEADIHEVLISHGNLIAYFTSQVFQAAPGHWINTDIQNAGLCEIFIRPDGLMRLVSHNDTGHLPLNKKTWV